MTVKTLRLRNFRNYGLQAAGFSDRLNILYGENAQGKTNILEAVFLCSTGRSHRTQKDAEMIKFGEDSASVVLEMERKNYGEFRIEIIIQRAGRKSILINGAPQRRAGDLLGLLNSVVFSPEDLSIIKDEPQVRRRFLDMFISQIKPAYFFCLQRYLGALRQRNALLRQAKENPRLLDTVSAWDAQLAEFGSKVIWERMYFIRLLSGRAGANHAGIADGRETLAVTYEPSLRLNNLSALAGAMGEAGETGATGQAGKAGIAGATGQAGKADFAGAMYLANGASIIGEADIANTADETNMAYAMGVAGDMDIPGETYATNVMGDLDAADVTAETEAAVEADLADAAGEKPGDNTRRRVERSIAELFTHALRQSLQSDVARMSTQYGPHKDDIAFSIDGRNARLYGSQGQQRTAALALKMAQVDVMAAETGDAPVLLLDDVMSELDKVRRENLSLNMKDTQTFITGTERYAQAAAPSSGAFAGASYYFIENGIITAT